MNDKVTERRGLIFGPGCSRHRCRYQNITICDGCQTKYVREERTKFKAVAIGCVQACGSPEITFPSALFKTTSPVFLVRVPAIRWVRSLVNLRNLLLAVAEASRSSTAYIHIPRNYFWGKAGRPRGVQWVYLHLIIIIVLFRVRRAATRFFLQPPKAILESAIPTEDIPEYFGREWETTISIITIAGGSTDFQSRMSRDQRSPTMAPGVPNVSRFRH